MSLTLVRLGLDVDGAESLARARGFLERNRYALVLTDMRLPDGMGLELVREVYQIAFEVARELYQEEWRRLRPRLLTLATWVGYDTDGRSDIGWNTTFAKRLMVQLDQLGHYRTEIRACLEHARDELLLAPLLELLDARLALAIKSAEDDLRTLAEAGKQDTVWRVRLAQTARDMVRNRGSRLTHADQALDLVERALAAVRDEELALRLCVLRAELCSQGLFGAGTHVRINAIQLHNAIRKTIGMDHAPDDPTHRLTYVNAIAKLIEAAEPQTINFASVTDERATARRMFMAVVQMLKHLDGSEPIRFLIAECETSFTILTALYFARLFGVEDRIDISPLFETRNALDRGAEIIAGALAVPA